MERISIADLIIEAEVEKMKKEKLEFKPDVAVLQALAEMEEDEDQI